VKSHPKSESKLLRRLLPVYLQVWTLHQLSTPHGAKPDDPVLVQYLEANPEALLCRFYGLYRLQLSSTSRKIHFLVMVGLSTCVDGRRDELALLI
jgi:hypothetical protein